MYHHGKANVVADALSRKTMSALIQDIFSRMMVTSPLMDMIKGAQVGGLTKEIGRLSGLGGKFLCLLETVRNIESTW